jgi:triosephosphate isomerase
MELSEPFLIINFKNYLEIGGEKSVKLAKVAEEVGKELRKEIIVAPPLNELARVAENTNIKVFAQHCDSVKFGSTTGHIVAELIKESGATGSLINHSERRIPLKEIGKVVKRLNSLKLISVVCARTPEEVKAIAKINPSYIAIEPPELIGSGRAVSKVRPEIVSESVRLAKHANPKAKVICGAGIVSGEDVAAAIRLGSVGVLVASGIVKAKNWREKILEISKNLHSFI